MILVDLPKAAILHPGFWRTSPPVRRLVKPERVQSTSVLPQGVWVDALNALTNTGAKALDYDQWRSVIFAVHEETGGSDDGLALAHAFSARSSKHVPEFLDDRVWPYIKAGGGITGRTIMSIAARIEGWSEPLSDADFPVIGPGASNGLFDAQHGGQRSNGRAATGRVPTTVTGTGDADVLAGGPTAGLAAEHVHAEPLLDPVERRGIPAAKHLCTDQANANRLVKQYGARVLVAAGRWYVWDGRRWAAEDAEVYRYACHLSLVIKEEAAALRKRAQAAGADPAALKKADELAVALEKWSVKSEMKGAIEAAIGLARKMLTVQPDDLDRDPWLLNVNNGVLDLRTGQLGPHDPKHLMTHLVEVDYDPSASSAEWERVLLDIVGGDDRVAAFLQRWFGYCLTAHTREQVIVVHWGDGANGKSTVLDLMTKTGGDYCGVAAPGLLASDGKGGMDRHPTEVAALHGRRMVTAHETREGVALREDFVKSATGGDKMTARFMREDFFDFTPTHKLQLLTNHKPQIRGQDRGIWRRVMLVAYGVTFGSAEEVARGEALVLRDQHVLERLSTPEALAGVLAWRVRGAVQWAEQGLRPPDAVLDASARYQGEQDRIRQFVTECCELQPHDATGETWWVPMTMGMDGLYPAYQGWCKESGFHALGRNRFADELKRVVKGCRISEGYGPGESGRRRKITRVEGLRLLPAE